MATTEYVVREGDDGISIAARFGFRDFEAIWNLPENEPLKKKRKDHDLPFPGDVVHVPERTPKTESASAKTVNKSRVTRPKRQLHVNVVERDGKPAANAAYELSVGG